MLQKQCNSRSVSTPGKVLQQSAPAHRLLAHLFWRNTPKKLLEIRTWFPIIAVIGSISCHCPDQQLRQLKPVIVRINLKVRCQNSKSVNLVSNHSSDWKPSE